MEYEELINKLKEEYGFIHKPLPNNGWGYTEYINETYNLRFTFGSSNGDTYFILRKNEEVVLHKNVSVFNSNFEIKFDKTVRKVYKKIQKIIRIERVNTLLK